MARSDVAVLLTGVGKRYDIVSAFAQHAFTIACDPNPLAPAQYAADLRFAPPRIDDPGYVPFLQRVVAEHNVGAVVPLTDLDLEVLGQADLPAFVPPPEIARDTFDKYAAHLLLTRHGLPSRRRCCHPRSPSPTRSWSSRDRGPARARSTRPPIERRWSSSSGMSRSLSWCSG